MLILMDERYDRLDERLSRVIFSAAEIPDRSELNRARDKFSKIAQGLAQDCKFHFAGMSQLDQQKVIDTMSTLGVRCKMYIFYALNRNESEMKKTALKWAIQNTRKSLSKRYILQFLIENAEQYGDIIRKENLVSDPALTIIPDAFCHTFARRLSNNLNSKWYDNLYEKSRLECYWLDGGQYRMMREDRLQKTAEGDRIKERDCSFESKRN